MLPADTLPEARRIQVEVWRRLGTSGRSHAAAVLSESLMNTARAQIAASHPEWSPHEVVIALIGRLHGPALAMRVAAGRPVPAR